MPPSRRLAVLGPVQIRQLLDAHFLRHLERLGRQRHLIGSGGDGVEDVEGGGGGTEAVGEVGCVGLGVELDLGGRGGGRGDGGRFGFLEEEECGEEEGCEGS